MATTKAVLKTYFQNGLKPTEAEFEEFIDAFVHVDDDLDLAIGAFAEVGEAEAGLVTDKYMNPFLTKAAIYALARLANIPELEAEVDAKIADQAKIFFSAGGPLPLPFLYDIGNFLVHNSSIVVIRVSSGWAYVI